MSFKIEYIYGLVNEEYSDYSLYKKESELFRNKIVNGKNIADVFKAFGSDEVRHAEKLIASFKIVKRPKIREILTSHSLRQTLRRHLIREKEAIEAYRRLKVMFLGSDIESVINDILSDEEKHYETIRKYLLLIR